MTKNLQEMWALMESGDDFFFDNQSRAILLDLHRRLTAVEKATLPQPYNPDEAEGGTAGGPVRMVCENHRDKAWPDECDCGPGMRDGGR